jgi:hypothetical protein
MITVLLCTAVLVTSTWAILERAERLRLEDRLRCRAVKASRSSIGDAGLERCTLWREHEGRHIARFDGQEQTAVGGFAWICPSQEERRP